MPYEFNEEVMTHTIQDDGGIYVVRLPNYPEGYDLPHPATDHSAGMDVRAGIEEPCPIPPSSRRLIPTGLKMQLPKSTYMVVCPRSGLAYKHGVTVLNSPGLIDSDYRGEVSVLLFNSSQETYTVEPAERIAQLVLHPVVRPTMKEVDMLDDTHRGEGGFGHTGRV